MKASKLMLAGLACNLVLAAGAMAADQARYDLIAFSDNAVDFIRLGAKPEAGSIYHVAIARLLQPSTQLYKDGTRKVIFIEEINCKAKTVQIQGFTAYDANNAVSLQSDMAGEVDSIDPGSLSDAARAHACDGVRDLPAYANLREEDLFAAAEKAIAASK